MNYFNYSNIRFAHDKEAQKKVLNLEERIEQSHMELDKKVLHEFFDSSWLHPKFKIHIKKRFKRFSGVNNAIDIIDGDNITELVDENFPNAKY